MALPTDAVAPILQAPPPPVAVTLMVTPPAAPFVARPPWSRAALLYAHLPPLPAEGVRRQQATVPAVADPAVFLAEHQVNLLGRIRIANTAEFRLYADDGADPVPGTSTVRATGAALPLSWTPTGDGDWRVGVTYFDGYIESGLYRVDRVQIAGGVALPNPPAGPEAAWTLEALAAGVVRIRALYNPNAASAPAADTWRIWYTVDGSTPNPAGAPSATAAMRFAYAGGADQLVYSLPGQADGVTVKVLVRTYRTAAAVASENSDVKSILADAAGPAAPGGIAVWRGMVG